MSLYFLLFYILSIFVRSINRRNKDFAISAMALISVLFTLNIMSVLYFFKYAYGTNLPTRTIAILIGLFFLGLNYLFLIKTGKDEEIIDEFDIRSKEGESFIRAKVIVGIYVLISFIVPIYLAYLQRGKK